MENSFFVHIPELEGRNGATLKWRCDIFEIEFKIDEHKQYEIRDNSKRILNTYHTRYATDDEKNKFILYIKEWSNGIYDWSDSEQKWIATRPFMIGDYVRYKHFIGIIKDNNTFEYYYDDDSNGWGYSLPININECSFATISEMNRININLMKHNMYYNKFSNKIDNYPSPHYPNNGDWVLYINPLTGKKLFMGEVCNAQYIKTSPTETEIIIRIKNPYIFSNKVINESYAIAMLSNTSNTCYEMSKEDRNIYNNQFNNYNL